jgi:hypothetical protein
LANRVGQTLLSPREIPRQRCDRAIRRIGGPGRSLTWATPCARFWSFGASLRPGRFPRGCSRSTPTYSGSHRSARKSLPGRVGLRGRDGSKCRGEEGAMAGSVAARSAAGRCPARAGGRSTPARRGSTPPCAVRSGAVRLPLGDRAIVHRWRGNWSPRRSPPTDNESHQWTAASPAGLDRPRPRTSGSLGCAATNARRAT